MDSKRALRAGYVTATFPLPFSTERARPTDNTNTLSNIATT